MLSYVLVLKLCTDDLHAADFASNNWDRLELHISYTRNRRFQGGPDSLEMVRQVKVRFYDASLMICSDVSVVCTHHSKICCMYDTC